MTTFDVATKSPESEVCEGLIALVGGHDADRWRDDAACKGRTVLFYPRRAERPEARERRENQAAKLCAKCPVTEQCRSFAREHHEYGFWAGESEEDRHRMGFTVSAPIGVRTRIAN